MARPSGTGAALAVAMLVLPATFLAAPFLPFIVRMGLNVLGLLALAAALGFSIGASLALPSARPALRSGAVIVLVLGVIAILLLAPFAAMALAAFAEPWAAWYSS